MIRFYMIRKIGTDYYLMSKKVEIWGHRNKAHLFKKDEVVRYLQRVSKTLPVGIYVPPDWEVVEYTLYENKATPAETFLIHNTKSPLIKL